MIKLLVSLKKYRWDKSMNTIIDIFSITLKMYHQNFNMFSSSYSLFICFIFFPPFLFLFFFAISIFFCTHYIVFISCHWIFIKVHFNLYICKLFKKEKEYLKLMEILFSTYSRKKNSNYTPTGYIEEKSMVAVNERSLTCTKGPFWFSTFDSCILLSLIVSLTRETLGNSTY
jgi:hypothetical protein